MSRKDDIKKLVKIYNRRLQILKEQRALQGISVEPKILIEIEDTEAEIEKLEKELEGLESVSVSTADTINSINKVVKPEKSSVENITEQRLPALQYSNLFQIVSFSLPYVVLIGGWQKDINEYREGEVTSIADDNSVFQLPDDFGINYIPNFYEPRPKCRLIRYDCNIMPHPWPNQLTFTFSKVRYLDYLMSGEHLDDRLPNDPIRTFRDKYASRLNLQNFADSQLTNICGVGIFILTRDNKVIVSKHSRSVKVYGDIWSYSASGTMDWNNNLHPFDEITRECFEEIGHQINLDNTLLFEFGIDTKKLYFQFSFFERTNLLSQDILGKARLAQDFHAEMEELIAIPFELRTVIDLVKNQPWEPAAAAGLLTLCTKEFGIDQVEKALDHEFVRKRFRDEMVVEWTRRALRPDELAVMSARYPFHRCVEESRKYVEAVIEFMGSDADGKDILEIGCGIGRLTEWLVLRADRLTCLDISKKMLDRNRERLGSRARKINYLQMFGQDYYAEKPHDLIISSLVLIHNVDEDDFHRLVEAMSICADTIFLFEHSDVAYQVSSHTRPRSEEELLSAFQGYHTEKRRGYQLFNDNLIFLKLVR